MNREYSELIDFLALVRRMSFRKAATERGTTTSAISHSLRSLESRLGVRLVNRTTRSVSLTEAGKVLYDKLEQPFRDIQLALETLNSFRDTPVGALRLNVPRSVAPLVIAPVLSTFVTQNPGLRLEVTSDDRLVDIVSEGYDAGIRFGERIAKDMIAVRIHPPLRFAVVGSPDYYRTHPKPNHPSELRAHSCIRYNFPSGTPFHWEFQRADEELKIEVDGPLTLDDQHLMLEAARRGVGLAFIFDGLADVDLRSGALVRVLQDWCPTLNDLFLYYANRAHMPAGLRALVQLIRS